MGLSAFFQCQEERGNCISGIGFFLIAEALEKFNGSGFINDSTVSDSKPVHGSVGCCILHHL